jgi:hypothetical protein
MSIELIADNLREVYIASHDPQVIEPQLVADFSGSRIYHASAGWGRVWKWFYNMVDFLCGSNFNESKLCQALEKTQKLISQQLDLIKEHVLAYQTYIEKSSLSLPFSEETYHLARKKITAWNLATGPFIQTCLEDINKNILAIGEKLFGNIHSREDLDYLFSLPYLQHLIDLEGFLHEPLPLELFLKLSCKKELQEKEIKTLRAWIEKHNQKNSPISIRPFHHALGAFVEATTLHFKGMYPNLVSLELALSDLGLKIFFSEDPVHLLWRSKLKPGDVLQTDPNLKVVLGEEIVGKEKEENHNLVFAVKNDPGKVVVIGSNQAILGLKKRVDEENGWGIPSATCISISENGDYGVFEKLVEPLENYQWSTDGSWVHSKDLEILTPIQNMLKWMIQQNLSPYKLEIKFLRFNQEGILKYSKICLPRGFNYTALEDFVFECANGNKTIFCHLMGNSGLYTHPYSKYYYKMFLGAIDDVKKDPSTLSANIEISDTRVVDQGELLYKQIKEIKERSKNQILFSHIVPDISMLEQAIKKEIKIFYNMTKLSGKLWPGMEKTVIANVINKEKLQPRACQ